MAVKPTHYEWLHIAPGWAYVKAGAKTGLAHVWKAGENYWYQIVGQEAPEGPFESKDEAKFFVVDHFKFAGSK